MGGLKYYTKLLLFICSYLPLFVILTINYWSTSLYINLICISLLSLSLLSWFLLIYLLKDINNVCGNCYKVVEISNESEVSLNYLFTYIIPFLSMQYDSWKNLCSIGILIFITLVMYINSNLLYMNPMLNLSHYSILKVVLTRNDNRYSFILITKTNDKDINVGELINVCEFSENIYYLTERNL